MLNDTSRNSLDALLSDLIYVLGLPEFDGVIDGFNLDYANIELIPSGLENNDHAYTGIHFRNRCPTSPHHLPQRLQKGAKRPLMRPHRPLK